MKNLLSVGLMLLMAGCHADPLSEVNEAVSHAEEVVVVCPAKPGIFLSSSVNLPPGKNVKVIERKDCQEFVVIYGMEHKPLFVILPLTAEKYQVLVDPPSLASYDSKVKPEPASVASVSETGSAASSVAAKSSAVTGHSAGGIKVGMTKAQVRKKYGDPDQTLTSPSGQEYWLICPVSVGHDLASSAVTEVTSGFGLFGGLAHDAGNKVTPSKNVYEVYFDGDVVVNVVLSTTK